MHQLHLRICPMRLTSDVTPAGYPQPVRAGMEDLQIQQNLQMGRICDVRGSQATGLCSISSTAISI